MPIWIGHSKGCKVCSTKHIGKTEARLRSGAPYGRYQSSGLCPSKVSRQGCHLKATQSATAICGVLSRSRVLGGTLEVVMGHATIAGLSNRAALSVFCSVYQCIRRHCSAPAELWSSARLYLPACRMVQAYEYFGLLLGFKLYRPWSMHFLLRQEGRGGGRPRQGARSLQKMWLASSVMGFPKLWGKWKPAEGIMTLEARAAVRALKRVALIIHGKNARQLMLVDSFSWALALYLCRSRQHKLLKRIQVFYACCVNLQCVGSH